MAQEYVDTQTGEVITAAELESRVLTQVQDSTPTAVAATPLDLPSEVFTAALDRRKANRMSLMQWVRDALVEGVDFGKIHVMSKDKCNRGRFCKDPNHFSKPSLWKPGAEKICGMLGVTAHFPALADYERTVLEGRKLQQVIIRCELHDAAGRAVADGVGARSLAQDSGDLNKALKMAEKAGMIDATLRMAGLSEVFTQDIEDMVFTRAIVEEASKGGGESRPGAAGNGRSKVVEINGNKDEEPRNGTRSGKDLSSTDLGLISASQLCTLRACISKYHLDTSRVVAWVQKVWQVRSLEKLTHRQFKRLLLDKIPQFAEQMKSDVINDGEVTVIREYVDEKQLDLDGLERWIGCPVDEITYENLDSFWRYLHTLANKKELEAMPEDERLRRKQANECMGRSETFGT